MTATERLTVHVDSIAAGGDGIARADGLVIFIPRTAPGDTVDARIVRKGRLARGLVESIVTPSPVRAEPACPHYDGDNCGGCQLQHLAPSAQHNAKRQIIQDSLRRIGHRAIELPELRATGGMWRYRRKLTLALRRSVSTGVWHAGLHAYDDPERVFSLVDCLISDKQLMVVWREILSAADCLPDEARLRGSVRLLDDRAAFVLEGGSVWPESERFFDRVPSLAALWWRPERGGRRLLHDRRTTATPGASFAQVNPVMADSLQAFVVASVQSFTPGTVVDAYAGAGDVAVELAARGARVTAIELDAEASAWSATRLPRGSRALTGRVEDFLPRALPADVVILNPPRTGVDARVTAALAANPPRQAIVYVSCDPATLARDLARLPAWRVARVTAFDMFPQTAHVETVVELVPGHAT